MIFNFIIFHSFNCSVICLCSVLYHINAKKAWKVSKHQFIIGYWWYYFKISEWLQISRSEFKLEQEWMKNNPAEWRVMMEAIQTWLWKVSQRFMLCYDYQEISENALENTSYVSKDYRIYNGENFMHDKRLVRMRWRILHLSDYVKR